MLFDRQSAQQVEDSYKHPAVRVRMIATAILPLLWYRTVTLLSGCYTCLPSYKHKASGRLVSVNRAS